MLPDFPDLKKMLRRQVQTKLDVFEKAQHPILSKIKSFTQHEGRVTDFEQVGYGRKQMEPELHSVQVLVRLDELPDLFGEKLDAKLMELANEMGAQKVRTLLTRVKESTEMTGQQVDAHGGPPTGAMLLDVLETIEESLDDSGNSKMSWLMHPDMVPAMQRASQEIDDDPVLRARRDRITETKRRQWVDRESRRKLVN